MGPCSVGRPLGRGSEPSVRLAGCAPRRLRIGIALRRVPPRECGRGAGLDTGPVASSIGSWRGTRDVCGWPLRPLRCLAGARAPWALPREEGVVGRTGFEPVKAVPSDLQSDPFGRSGISPCGSGSGDRSWRNARHSRRLAWSGRRCTPAGAGAAHVARATVLPCPPRDRFVFPVSVRRAATAGLGGGAAGASGGTRTRNLLITNQLLCQLSHAGVQQGPPRGRPWRPTSDLRDPGPG